MNKKFTDNGWKDYKQCERCGKSTFEQIPAIGGSHDYVYHQGKEPTCEEIGWNSYTTCSKCSYSTYIEKKALGHHYYWYDDKEPTCTESGYKNYGICYTCDNVTREEIPALQHELVSHSAKKATCASVGWKAYETCSRCDYSTYSEVKKLKHTYVNHKAKKPTATKKGWKAYKTCKKCSYTTYKELPALGSIKLNRKNVTLQKNEHFELKLTIKSPYEYKTKWSSSNKNIVYFNTYDDEHLYFTANRLGTTTITAKYGSLKKSCKVKVDKIEGVAWSGTKHNLRNKVKNIPGYKKAKWKSNNKNVVTVNKKGKATLKKAGVATVTCTIKGVNYKIKFHSYSKKRMKTVTVNTIKKYMMNPSSFKLKRVTYPDIGVCWVTYTGIDDYGYRYTHTLQSQYFNGSVVCLPYMVK